MKCLFDGTNGKAAIELYCAVWYNTISSIWGDEKKGGVKVIRIGICDDSPAFLYQTESMINHWDRRPQNMTVELFQEGDSLVSVHTQNPFDIILLDVVMPLLNGIEVAREIREKDKTVKIIFLTSSVDFAVESYSVKACNYLLKPIDPIQLFSCLEEVVSAIQSSLRWIPVKSINATRRVILSEIEYIEAQGKHIIFSMIDKKTVHSLEPLYTYENKLVLEDGFFRCHRSYIVNIHHIDSYSHKEIIMRSGSRVPISRSCQKDFEEMYFYVVFGKAGGDK